MKILKCDRCGKEYPKKEGIVTHFGPLESDYSNGVLANAVTGITLRYNQHLVTDKDYTRAILTPDLCDECVAGLVKYLEEK